mgnify:CR=1 FL=1
MAEDWSPEEVAATVADYFEMLDRELRGEDYNKREHNRRLQAVLNNRSAGAIEFKHANISAVLIECGFPYIAGYKPRGNYQELLRTEVMNRLDGAAALATAAAAIVDAAAPTVQTEQPLLDVFVDPPLRDPTEGFYERRRTVPVVPRHVDYLAMEARNASLGAAGELFVLGVEHRRLWEAGCRPLAERIDHVSRTQGDGLGYDIRSYDVDGHERLIEVKTTAFGIMTPFYATPREVAVSEEQSGYHLYRVFKFRESPKIFALQGSLKTSVRLEPSQFKAFVA